MGREVERERERESARGNCQCAATNSVQSGEKKHVLSGKKDACAQINAPVSFSSQFPFSDFFLSILFCLSPCIFSTSCFILFLPANPNVCSAVDNQFKRDIM